MSENKNNDVYEVGYKRPPRSTRFKPGQSGNPKGRCKGSRNFATVLEAELNARVPVTENGIRKTISKREAVAKHLVNKAASGHLPAAKLLLEQERQQEQELIPSSNVPRELLPPDHRVLESLRQRLLQIQSTPVATIAEEYRPSQQGMGEGPVADNAGSSLQTTSAGVAAGLNTRPLDDHAPLSFPTGEQRAPR